MPPPPPQPPPRAFGDIPAGKEVGRARAGICNTHSTVGSPLFSTNLKLQHVLVGGGCALFEKVKKAHTHGQYNTAIKEQTWQAISIDFAFFCPARLLGQESQKLFAS